MWQIKIHDPSGEIRTLPIQAEATLGRGESASIRLRDNKTAAQALTLWASGSSRAPYWFRVSPEAPPVLLGGLEVREAQLPPGFTLSVGETRISIEQQGDSVTLPQQPNSVRHWLTCTETGKNVLWTSRKAAATPLSLYLAGETGTGKEVLAHLIHAWSERASGPFVPLHCGALPLSLAESELFGHVKGAFTGAMNHRAGALMQAHNGTLFLDEVGDLPLDIQVKLLRFLENGEIRPVGADRPSRADVRLLCATHHPLEKLVEEGKFRRDLYYRIASVTIQIPPLRSRPEDIELLAQRFARDLRREIAPRAMLRLQAHAWPGNVRELRHAIERASGLAGPFTSVLGEEAFAFLLTAGSLTQSSTWNLGEPGSAMLTLQEMERVMLLRALKLGKGNRAQAAKILGIARSTLFEMLKRHRIPGPRTESRGLTELVC